MQMFGIPFIKREASYWVWVDNKLSGSRADSAWTNFHLWGLRQHQQREFWLKSGRLTSDLTQAQTRDGQLPLQWLKVFAATSRITHSLPLTLLQASPDKKGSLSTLKHNFCSRNTENYSMSSIFHRLIFLKGLYDAESIDTKVAANFTTNRTQPRYSKNWRRVSHRWPHEICRDCRLSLYIVESRP